MKRAKPKGILLFVTVALLVMPTTAAADIGSSIVGAQVGGKASGRAQSYRLTASAGAVDRLNVYLDASNGANRVVLGLYSDRSNGQPNQLLRSCTVRPAVGGAWNRCAIPAFTPASGVAYHLVILGPDDTRRVRYRTTTDRSTATYGSSSSSLLGLPASWSGGLDGSGNRATVYADKVPVAPPPTAAFTWSPLSPLNPPVLVSFTSTGTCPAAPCTYEWRHGPPGNEPIGTGQGSSWTFQSTGTKTVVLRVTDTLGRSAEASNSLTVGASAPLPPSPPLPDPQPSTSGDQFPNRATTGTPDGWVPAQTRSTDLTVSTPGAVVQDIRFTGGADLIVQAPGVVARRLDFQGGVIGIMGAACTGAQFTLEDTTFGPRAGQAHTFTDGPVIWDGNYVARRVEIINRDEGYRASDCGAQNSVRVEDSFTYIYAADPGTQACEDTHADGYQSFHARGATFVNNTIIFKNECGTSPYYAGYGGTYPNPSINTGLYNVDRMLVGGGGVPYRHQTPGSVTGLRIVADSPYFTNFYIDNRCSVLSPWEAKIVTLEDPAFENANNSYRVASTVRDQPCDTEIIE